MNKRLVVLLTTLVALAAQVSPGSAQARDGRHDFDWETGTWSTSLRLLTDPLSDAPDHWLGYAGTSVVRSVMGGDSNLVELDVAGTMGRIRGVSLRLYDPASGQWSLNFANMRDGRLTAPVHGGFDARGRGLFYGQDSVEGRFVLVRFTILPETRDRVRFVQSYSVDAGATWEDNWIAVDQRRPPRA